MYKVIDSYNNVLKKFNTYKQAYTFLIMNQRYDWQIIKY